MIELTSGPDYTRTLTVGGSEACDVNGCQQRAAIVNIRGHQRFCEQHRGVAARVVLQYPSIFSGWYAIDEITTRQRQLLMTIHPL